VNKFLERFREYISTSQFNAIRLGLASPEKVRSLSYGEVKKIETINYRTLKPERDGLFCARIFGPQKDWECNCGKYKRMKHRGVTCEKCGVEVIQSRVRRERMGHIELIAPVVHIWYLKGVPSYLSLILDMSVKDLERVIYFDSYLVVHQGKSPYTRKTLLSNADYEQYTEAHPEDTDFVAESGAEAMRSVLSLIDFSFEVNMLEEEYQKNSSVTSRLKLMRRRKILTGLMQAGIRPEWMVLSVLPVLPPDLRPLVPLEGGRFASSDLNELYRRVLNRNIRLQRLIEIEAPQVIIKNEKRMLQEAIDALIDNGRRGQPVRGTNRRPLKSLSEMLRGKQGRFRQNLLGKRVDYSGRSVIVVDPELNLNQCGLPKIMALELFKSYVYAELLRREVALNMRVAKKLVEDSVPEAWDALEYVVKDRTVLLNRAPTLHRLGIQGFHPVLVDGKAIKIHPLVCAGFSADFDGDQMAVHIPLSKKAQLESDHLILSSHNLLSPKDGRPITVPSQDMVLGLHYITKVRLKSKGEGLTFASLAEVIAAYQHEMVSLHARIKIRLDDGRIVDTTIGRALLYEALPKGSSFDWINKVMGKRDLVKLVENVYYQFGNQATVVFLDNIKRLGFNSSTRAGISFSIADLVIPSKKDELIAQAEKDVEVVEQLYRDGAITNGERYNKVISIWDYTTKEVAKVMSVDLEAQDKEAFENSRGDFKPFNPIFLMLESGARGSREQIKQLVGMRGPMTRPSGEIIETPVKSNFKQGLSVFEYFISSHGARKGQADTALKTANAGYLTRRLVDVAQDVVVTMKDCGTLGYIELEDLKEAGAILQPLSGRLYGRVLAARVIDPVSGELLFEQNHIMNREDVERIKDSAVSKGFVRSMLTCLAKRGVCSMCYGFDLARGELVDVGATVGIIAAQSIGEPGTQLTMKTFHIGGTASGISDQSAFFAKHDGIVELKRTRTVTNREGKHIIMSRKASLVIKTQDGRELQEHALEYGSVLLVEDGQAVTVGAKLAEWDLNNKLLLTEKAGRVKYVDLIPNVTFQEKIDEVTGAVNRIVLEHKGDKYQPALTIVDNQGEELAQYYVAAGNYLIVASGQQVGVGDALVKMPREAYKTKDITVGGLPRISELFEARVPKDPAIIADIDGEVVFGGLHRGMRKISVVSGYETYDYLIPRGKQLMVVNGDRVSAGDLLTSGSPVLHDILRIQGPEILQRYLVNQIQEIYRSQGIDINDRHIELLVRQMLRKVRIVEPGDSDFLVGDRVDRIHFKTVNALLQAEGKKPAVAKPMLMGIAMAALGAESFFSAASFQETTRILSSAAVGGQVDYLYGLKENVIIGRLIPAGSGVTSFKKKYLGEDTSSLEQQAQEEEKKAILSMLTFQEKSIGA
jgi:DNA-directed RNA polymerase subunit beta'